eukprot:m.242050 g.242050  ORF g.242050 m.242050 type:complete len:664 (-) comp33787_c0_seq2:148-2139(-)
MQRLQFMLFFVIGAVKSADVYEFNNTVRFKVYPTGDNEYGNEFQAYDFMLGKWKGNALAFGGGNNDLPGWSKELRADLRKNLFTNVTADPRFAGVVLDFGNTLESFSNVVSVQQCAELCLFVATLAEFGDLSCGGFQYSVAADKCWPAQGWVIGKEYNDSCKNSTSETEYCCIKNACCVTEDKTAPDLESCDLQYQPRRTSTRTAVDDASNITVYIRMFPPTLAPTTRPTQEPTLGPTKPPTQYPTLGPTISPTFFPTKTPTATPTSSPTVSPSTSSPSQAPTSSPTTSPPTQSPTTSPSMFPTKTKSPTRSPTTTPTAVPTSLPTLPPSSMPSSSPTLSPTFLPTTKPSSPPSTTPTVSPVISSASSGGSSSAVPVIAAVVAVVVLIAVAVVVFCVCRNRGSAGESKPGIKQRTESVNQDVEATNHGFRKFEINNSMYATANATATATASTDLSDYATVEDMKSTTETTTATSPTPSTATATTKRPQLPKGAPPKAMLPPSNTPPTGKPPVAQVIYGLSGASDADYAYTEPAVDTNATYSTVNKNRGGGDIMYATVEHASSPPGHSNGGGGGNSTEPEVMYAELQGNPMYTTVEHTTSLAKKPKLPSKLVVDATYEDMDAIVGNHVKNQEDSVTYADIETQINKSAVLYADPLDTMGMGYAA